MDTTTLPPVIRLHPDDTVAVPALPIGARVEIEAWAYVGDN